MMSFGKTWDSTWKGFYTINCWARVPSVFSEQCLSQAKWMNSLSQQNIHRVKKRQRIKELYSWKDYTHLRAEEKHGVYLSKDKLKSFALFFYNNPAAIIQPNVYNYRLLSMLHRQVCIWTPFLKSFCLYTPAQWVWNEINTVTFTIYELQPFYSEYLCFHGLKTMWTNEEQAGVQVWSVPSLLQDSLNKSITETEEILGEAKSMVSPAKPKVLEDHWRQLKRMMSESVS